MLEGKNQPGRYMYSCHLGEGRGLEREFLDCSTSLMFGATEGCSPAAKARVLQEINMQTLLFEDCEKMKDKFKMKSKKVGGSICLGSLQEQWLGGAAHRQHQPEPLHPR